MEIKDQILSNKKQYKTIYYYRKNV